MASAIGIPVLLRATYTEESEMIPNLRSLPIEERIRLVEDLWDSIASDQAALPLTDEQKAELDRRLEAYEADGNKGSLAHDVIAAVRQRL